MATRFRLPEELGARMTQTELARQADARAKQAILESIKSQAQADFLREEGEDIDNG